MSDYRKNGLIATMVELLQSTDHTNIHSRLAGHPQPHLIRGTRSHHRPDVWAQGKTRNVAVDTVTSADMKNLDLLKERLQLLYVSALEENSDLHLACFAANAEYLKMFCRRHAIRYSKLWEI